MNKEKVIDNIICSACNETLPKHEQPINIEDVDVDEIECISCENKFWDSVDIDNFGTQ